MSSSRSIRVEIDHAGGVAYICFSDNDVKRTVEIVPDELLIDLDAYDVAVGIEVLNLDADIPFHRLTSDFHVPSHQVELLRLIRPNMTSFIGKAQVSDTPFVAASTARATVPC